jgi:NAD(P)-dependent dehydrogenase (short-subunit alcohol dehydrogenase family)
MTTKQKTIIVTGASQGIGAAVANLFLERGYNVVGNSRKISQKNELQPSEKLALVDGDIGLASTAEMIVGLSCVMPPWWASPWVAVRWRGISENTVPRALARL